MTVAIIGAGNVGRAIGHSLGQRGYSIRYGVPDPLSHGDLMRTTSFPVLVADVAQAIAPVEVVILATPFNAALQVARNIADWKGRILVDVTNPIAPGLSGLVVGHTSSGAEQIAQAARNARVVKAFNTTGFENMRDPHFRDGDVFMPVASDDAAARRKVIALATVMGFDAVELGPLRNARYLEPAAMVWIEMAMRLGHGRYFGFARLRRVVDVTESNQPGDSNDEVDRMGDEG